MIRIAYCIHSLHRAAGMERVLSLKANLLSETGEYQVFIITSRLRGRKPAFKLNPQIQLIDLGISETLQPRRYATALERKLTEIEAQICISMGGNEIFALPNCHDQSIKISEFHFSHDKFHLKYGNKLFGRLYADWRIHRIEKVLNKLDGFVVLTKGDKEDWQKYTKCKVHQIYNPLTFSCSEKAELGTDKCIAIGRLDAQKNFHDLILAWERVAQSCPDAILEIYGEGRLHKSLQKLIDNKRLSERVKLMGSSKQIKEKLLESSCIVMSSKFEGFPMVLLEAASCCVPMISYDCPRGPAEIIEDGVNGRLVEYGNVEKLAEAVIDSLQDRNKLLSMGTAAKLTAERFTPDVIINQWDEYFKKLLKLKF